MCCGTHAALVFKASKIHSMHNQAVSAAYVLTNAMNFPHCRTCQCVQYLVESFEITNLRYAAMSCRQSSADLAESHLQALHKMVMSMAHCCDAYQPTGDANLEPADQHMASHTLQQLTQLTAHLLQALPLHPRQHLAPNLLVVSLLIPDACLEPWLHTCRLCLGACVAWPIFLSPCFWQT